MTTPNRVVREDEAKQMTGLGRTKRWQMEKAGRFPKRRVIAGRVTGYMLDELLEFLASRPVSEYVAPAAALRARGIVART